MQSYLLWWLLANKGADVDSTQRFLVFSWDLLSQVCSLFIFLLFYSTMKIHLCTKGHKLRG